MRVSPGPQTNVDWLYEIRNGRAFSYGNGNAASVGNYSEIQLMNPVGSGITCYIYQAVLSPSAATSVAGRNYNTPLGTDVSAGANLQYGGAVSACHFRTATPAAPDGTVGVYSADFAANVGASPFPLWLGVLDAGEGLMFFPSIVNTKLSAAFFWVEK